MKTPPMLQRLARLLNCHEDHVEDALRNDAERARHVLGRRGFLSAAAALAVAPSATSTVYSFPEVIVVDDLAEWRRLQAEVQVITKVIGHYMSVVFHSNYVIGSAP